MARDRSKSWSGENKQRWYSYWKKWASKNREYINEKKKQWRAGNKAHVIAWRKEHTERNKERLTKYNKDYRFRTKERDKIKIYYANLKRKKHVKRATPAWANHFFIREAYLLSSLRSEMTGYRWEVDHIVPLQSSQVCGLHVENNIRVVPRSVNRSKGNSIWPDMP